MADIEDLQALSSGDNDLAHRDFRQAELENKSLVDRDFSGALLQGAVVNRSDLSRSKFSGANTAGMIAKYTKLNNIDGTSNSWLMVDFTDAELINANFELSHFSRINFQRADLRGANFKRCSIDESCNFLDAKTDENTLFDGAKIIRSLARQEAFRYYKVERGILVRLQPHELSAVNVVDHGAKADIIAVANAVERAVGAALAVEYRDIAPAHGFGHNNPPPDQALGSEELGELLAAVSDIKSKISVSNINHNELRQSIAVVELATKSIGNWVVDKANVFSNEFAKSLGKEAATVKFWVALWMFANVELTRLTNLMLAYLS